MGAYLDRLHAQYDEARQGIDAIIDRAAADNRDVTDDEQVQVDRDQAQLATLQTAIEHYTDLDQRTGKVAGLRGQVTPIARTTAPADPPEAYDIAREFPTPGDYAVTLHRAMVHKSPDAIAAIDRATAHQKLADNPGLIPRPILGPVVNMIEGSRPFIQSITRRPLPTGKFDRPKITQHVEVGKQAAEKDLTASQKMLVGLLPVQAATYAGHLNISRQDIKWTSPGILNIVYDDFATIYAIRTCEDASAQFLASIAGQDPTPVPPAADGEAANGQGVTAALYTAVAAQLSASDQLPDTLWVSPDVWAQLGGMANPMGAQSFPSLSLTNQGGNPLGLRLVVDQHFPAGTMVAGPSRFVEWYEDVDGLLQVGEPDVLGQLVGFAGYGAFVNVAPEAFSVFELPAVAP